MTGLYHLKRHEDGRLFLDGVEIVTELERWSRYVGVRPQYVLTQVTQSALYDAGFFKDEYMSERVGMSALRVLNCRNCNKPILGHYATRYCSRWCERSAHGTQPVRFVCANCGKSDPEGVWSWRHRQYCSPACKQAAWRRQRPSA